MRRRCRYIAHRPEDPVHGTYVRENGRWKRDDTGGTQIYLAIRAKLGSVPGNRTLGNRLMARTKIGQNYKAEIEKDLYDAVQPLLDTDIIDSFEALYVERNASNPSRIDYGYHWQAEGQDYYHDDSLAIGSN